MVQFTVFVTPDRKVAFQVTDDAKIIVTASFEPEAAEGIAAQITACAELAALTAPPKKMNS